MGISHPFPAQVLAAGDARADARLLRELCAAALTCAGDCAARADPPRPGDAARCYEAAVAEVAKMLEAAGGGGDDGGALRALLCDALLGVAVARRDLGDDAGFRDAAGKYLGAGGDAAALPAEEAATQRYEPWSQSDEALTMPFELKQEPDDAPRPAARARLAVAPRPAPDAGGGLRRRFVHLRLPAGFAVLDGRAAPPRGGAGAGGGTGNGGGTGTGTGGGGHGGTGGTGGTGHGGARRRGPRAGAAAAARPRRQAAAPRGAGGAPARPRAAAAAAPRDRAAGGVASEPLAGAGVRVAGATRDAGLAATVEAKLAAGATTLEARLCRGGTATAAALRRFSLASATLRTVELRGCGLDLACLSPLRGAALPVLERLDLGDNPLTRRPAGTLGTWREGALALEALVANEALRDLDVSRACRRPAGADYPPAHNADVAAALARGLAARTARLRRLVLAGNAFAPESWAPLLAAVGAAPPTEVLDVAECVALAAPAPPSLTWARDLARAVAGCGAAVLDDARDLVAAAGGPSGPNAPARLSALGVGDAELVVALAPRVARLDASYRPAAPRLLRSLGAAERLAELALRGCGLGAEGLCLALRAPALRSLDAAENDLSAVAGDAAASLAAAAAAHPTLATLDLSFTRLPPAASAALGAAFRGTLVRDED